VTDILPANATGFNDQNPPAIACYVVQVYGGNPVGSIDYGQSDAACVFRGVAQGSPPPHFKIQMNETPTSYLSWTAPPGGAPNGYTLIVIPVDGSGLSFPQVAAGATSMTHNTSGKITCYQLLVNGTNNQTNALCAFPDGGALTASAPAVLRNATERIRQGPNLPAARGLQP
jgi:hypothetical protein